MQPDVAPGPPMIVIVGGGYSGASAAVQLVRRSADPLSITIVDPSERPGRGLAYSAIDPDHRLNAPTFVHSLIPDDAWHMSRWCHAEGVLASDPDALRPDGTAFIRRSDYGRYIEQTLQSHAHWPGNGSTIGHVRDTAIGMSRATGPSGPGEALMVTTKAGRSLRADLVIAATGNPRPRLQPPFDPELAGHRSVIADPLDTRRLYDIPADARVLLVGSGLTALDVLSTLVRRGHRGAIVVASRHGLRPRPQGQTPGALTQARNPEALAAMPRDMVLERIGRPSPAFLSPPAVPPDVRSWLRALRTRIAQVEAGGGTWYEPFDELRDSVWRLWPTLPRREKRRFLHTLRSWYDAHRFRSPPQTDEIVEAARAQGRIRFVAARLRSVFASDDSRTIGVALKPRGEVDVAHECFDIVVNCTGLDATTGLAANPFLAALAGSGWIRPDPCGLGFEVDTDCRAIGADGTARAALRLVGPPTVGSFGDPIGAMFIAMQIHRMLPDAMRGLGVRVAAVP